MKRSTFAGIAGVGAAVLAFSSAQLRADAPAFAATAEEIAQALRGKVCTTRVGASFTFGAEGQYAYDGLWKNGGQYVIGEGIVTITLDSGLERSFAISRHDDVFYMEQTALRCRGSGTLRS